MQRSRLASALATFLVGLVGLTGLAPTSVQESSQAREPTARFRIIADLVPAAAGGLRLTSGPGSLMLDCPAGLTLRSTATGPVSAAPTADPGRFPIGPIATRVCGTDGRVEIEPPQGATHVLVEF